MTSGGQEAMDSPTQRNPNKLYLYHQDHNHDTEKSIQLCDEIEELIRHDGLDQFIWQRREQENQQKWPQVPKQPQRAEPQGDESSYGIVNIFIKGE